MPNSAINDDEQEASDFVIDVNQDQYLRSVALFYLKLQAKFLLPSSTIQNIIEEYQDIHSIGHAHLLSKLKEKLGTLAISEKDIGNLVSDLSKQHLLLTFNTGLLRSDQSRKSFFQTEFYFIEPVEIYLGQDHNGKSRFCQYVPIHKTLAALLKQAEVKRQYQQTRDIVAKGNIFDDVSDGKVFLSNKLFQEQASPLRLLLYQDGFEVVNPLGSDRCKHKVMAVYLSLADLFPYSRSNIDHMQLVLLCREKGDIRSPGCIF